MMCALLNLIKHKKKNKSYKLKEENFYVRTVIKLILDRKKGVEKQTKI
jgi:hypothetical protein